MTTAANVFGQALYGLCKDEGLSEPVLQQLALLKQSFQQTPEYLQLLSAPNIALQERCALLDSAFREHVHIYVLNFLKLLTEKGAIRQFSACVEAYVDFYNQDHDILPVTAVTAIPLSQQQIARLTEKISGLTGKNAQLHNRVDPDCMGGVMLDYDGKRIDGSIAGRLAAVRDLLKNTVL